MGNVIRKYGVGDLVKVVRYYDDKAVGKVGVVRDFFSLCRGRRVLYVLDIPGFDSGIRLRASNIRIVKRATQEEALKVRYANA